MAKLCGFCRRPVDDVAGHWRDEPVCPSCADDLNDAGETIRNEP